MASQTPPSQDRARIAGPAIVLALEAALAAVDIATPGGVVFTSAYLVAPLAMALFASPRIVAATGALSVALAIASGGWDNFFANSDHVLRCAIVALGSLLAVLSARSRRSVLLARAQTEAAWRVADSARERLDVMLGALAEAVTVHDEHGQTVYANEAAVRLLGAKSLGDLLSAKPGVVASRFRMTREDGSAVGVDDLPGRRAVQGEAAEPTLTRSVNLDTGDEYWLLTKATVVHDEAGRPLAVNIIEDVTVAKDTERRQRFLAEAGRLLASSLDCEVTLAQLARLMVPALGDWCAIDLVDELGDLDCVAVAHADPAKVALVQRLRDEFRPGHEDSNGVARVARTGVAELHPRITDEMMLAAAIDRAQLELCREIGLRSAIIAPMRAGEHVHGVISLVTSDSHRELHAGDLAFVADLALRAGGRWRTRACTASARAPPRRCRTASSPRASPSSRAFAPPRRIAPVAMATPSAATSTICSRSAATSWCCSATSPARASTRRP